MSRTRVILAVPSRGTIMPRYEPPVNASPAMLRFLERKTFDEKAFAAAVLDLAARGYMTISGGKSKPYVFSRLRADDSALPADEIALASLLFHDESVLRIDLGHSEAIQFAKQTMAKCIESLAAPYFLSNARFVAGGIIVTFAALLTLVAQTALPGAVLFGCAAIAVLGSLMASAGSSALREIRHSLERRSGFGLFMAIIEVNDIIAPAILALVCALVIALFARFISIAFGLFVLSAMVINITAFYRRKILNRRGRELLDESEGFRQFLATAEAGQLNRMSDSVSAPEIISVILPYALAFDLEHRWGDRRFAHAFGFAGGEFLRSKEVEQTDLLPHGVKLPNPFDLASLANFLMEVDPRMKDTFAQRKSPSS